MAQSNMASKIRKQNALSLKVKMQLLQAVDAGDRSKTDICKQFGIPNSTLSTVIKNRGKLTSVFEASKFRPEQKRLRTPKYEDLDVVLLIWLKQARAQNLPISGPVLMSKANSLAQELGIEFRSSHGWLERFKKRNNINFKSGGCGGESRNSSTNLTLEWITSTLPSLLKNYSAKDIFSADETGIFFRSLPDKTTSFKGQKCELGEKPEERLTVMLACNSDGSEKLPLTVIGNFPNPPSFQSVQKMPVDYASNKNAWMTTDIFTNWIRAVDRRFLLEKRKVALVVDTCPAHPTVDNLEAINLVFLPPNATSVLQLPNQGVIQNLKFHYRKLLLQKFICTTSQEKFGVITLLDSLHLLRAAWRLVAGRTIEDCFCQAGFTRPSAPNPGNKQNAATKPKTFRDKGTYLDCDTFGYVSSFLNLPQGVTFDDYLAMDDCVATTSPLADDGKTVDRSRVFRESDSSASSGCAAEVIPIPSASDVLGMLRNVSRYLDTQSDSGNLHDQLDELEQFVTAKIVNVVRRGQTS